MKIDGVEVELGKTEIYKKIDGISDNINGIYRIETIGAYPIWSWHTMKCIFFRYTGIEKLRFWLYCRKHP